MEGLNLALTSEKEVTIDDVVAEGDSMYRYVKSRYGKATPQEIHSEITRDHPQFSKSYPLVVRYMCDLKQYSSRALRQWLTKIKSAPWKSEAEYIESQADYVYKLVCAKNPRSSTTDKIAVKANLRRMLMEEHNSFKAGAENAEKAVTAREDMLNDRNRDELYAFMKKLTSDDIDSIGTFRVETDVETAPRKSITEILVAGGNTAGDNTTNVSIPSVETVWSASSLFGI